MEREKADKLMSTMFDEGADIDSIESDEMKLVYTEAFRQRRCNATLNIDYPDAFYAGPNEGWKNLKILTPIEKETYNIDSPEGLIVVCLVQPNLYDQGFNAREIKVGDLKQHPLVSFRVNGQDVEALSWLTRALSTTGREATTGRLALMASTRRSKPGSVPTTIMITTSFKSVLCFYFK
jgi:hypothetical protein